MFSALLVEDNLLFRRTLKDTLLSWFPAIEVREAENGEQAMASVREGRPDLIFMDIQLPGENGLILTRRLKRAHPEIVIVILTSYDLPEYRQAAADHQANYFLTKDRPASEIRIIMNDVMAAREAQGRAPLPCRP